MSRKIKIKLNAASIDSAIKELERYKKWVAEKTAMLTERLAMIGVREASVRFTTAMYDGDNDSSVSVEPTENGWKIVASGNAVTFLEFGAGVYHNPTEPYPNPRPDGIVGIGEYGKGHGKRQAWGYYDGGDLVITSGNPAAMPMWYATKEMESQVLQIAREVFANGNT